MHITRAQILKTQTMRSQAIMERERYENVMNDAWKRKQEPKEGYMSCEKKNMMRIVRTCLLTSRLSTHRIQN
jgi:hypothetical protein